MKTKRITPAAVFLLPSAHAGLLGALVLVAVIILAIGGIVMVGKKIADRLEHLPQRFPDEEETSAYDGFEASNYYVGQSAEYQIPEGTLVRDEWVILWTDDLSLPWLPIQYIYLSDEQVGPILRALVARDVAVAQEAALYGPATQYRQQSGFYQAERVK